MPEIFYKTKYSYHEESRWKPHWLEIWYDYNERTNLTSNAVLSFEITHDYEVYEWLRMNYGSEGDNKRWSHMKTVNWFLIADKEVLTHFLIVWKGRSVMDLVNEEFKNIEIH